MSKPPRVCTDITRQDPRTRDAVLARVIEEANEQVDDDWTTADTLAFREYFGERLATRLAEAGLLADPAQTTELEQLRGQRRGLWELLKKSVRVTQVVLSTKIPRWDEDNVVAKFGWREGRCGKCGEDLPVTTEERDRLSLLLRGMARKLVAYRKWMSGDDVPVVHRLRREAEERQDRLDAVTATYEAADVMVRMGMATSPLRWETAKAVLDDVRAALVGDQSDE